MVVKFKGTFTKHAKHKVMEFILETMSLSSRVRQYAVDNNKETICRITSAAVENEQGLVLCCELQSLEPIYDGAEFKEWKRKMGRMEVARNGRAKWVGDQVFVDKNGKEVK